MPTLANKVTIRITEALTTSAKPDRENGILRGVKLIGFESKNGRSYPPSVLKSAVHLYEGAKVNIDHPEPNNPNRPRLYTERFGVIRSARFVEGSGIFADLHFNPKHSCAEQFCWDAENNPTSLGFSHNASLTSRRAKDGKEVIEQIVNIRSMDLVADPATTSSLFESENFPTVDDQPITPDQGDPKDQVKNAFKQMVIAAFDDSSLDAKATLKKIGEIMKAQSKLMGVEAPAEPAADPSTEEGIVFQKQLATLKQQVEQYQAKEKQAKVLESINKQIAASGLDPKNTVHVSETFSKQLLATESEDDRLALIKDRAALLGARSRTEVHQPTYTPQTNVTEAIDSKTFASRILS